jgi:hypothetical protein
MGALCGPQGRERQNTATRYLLAVTGSTRAKAAIPEITALGWAGVARGSANSLCSPPIRCFAHFIRPIQGPRFCLLSQTPRATSTCCCSNQSLLPCLFLVPRSVAPLRLPQSFFPSSSVLRLIARCCCAAAARNPLQAPLPSRLAQPRPHEKRPCFHPLADSFAQEPFRSVEYTNYPLC